MGNYKAGLVWRAEPVWFLRACSPEDVGFFSSFELKSFIGKVLDEQGESLEAFTQKLVIYSVDK